MGRQNPMWPGLGPAWRPGDRGAQLAVGSCPVGLWSWLPWLVSSDPCCIARLWEGKREWGRMRNREEAEKRHEGFLSFYPDPFPWLHQWDSSGICCFPHTSWKSEPCLTTLSVFSLLLSKWKSTISLCRLEEANKLQKEPGLGFSGPSWPFAKWSCWNHIWGLENMWSSLGLLPQKGVCVKKGWEREYSGQSVWGKHVPGKLTSLTTL